MSHRIIIVFIKIQQRVIVSWFSFLDMFGIENETNHVSRFLHGHKTSFYVETIRDNVIVVMDDGSAQKSFLVFCYNVPIKFHSSSMLKCIADHHNKMPRLSHIFLCTVSYNYFSLRNFNWHCKGELFVIPFSYFHMIEASWNNKIMLIFMFDINLFYTI